MEPVFTVHRATKEDIPNWMGMDAHIIQTELIHKIDRGQAYVLEYNGRMAGLLRYNLFWDSIPFCNLLFIEKSLRGRGGGTVLLQHWEQEMKAKGYSLLLTSTQVDEQAQHFYRKLGYCDCGGLLLTAPGYAQPMELFLCKALDQQRGTGNK